MVVVEAPGEVEVVEFPAGPVVLVVVLVAAVVEVVVVLCGAVVDVVVVLGVVVVVLFGGGVKMFPLPALPKIDPRGLPEMSSIETTSMRASTKTTAAVPASTGQENWRPGRAPRTAGGVGVVVA